MTDEVLSVFTCPYCANGEPILAVDLRALRTVTYREVLLTRERPKCSVVAIGEHRADPCPHLLDLAVRADWVRLLRRDDGPRGRLQARWWHPATAPVPAEWIGMLQTAVMFPSVVPPLVTPFRVVEEAREGVVEGRPATRSWRWSVSANAVFTTDGDRLVNEFLSTVLRRPSAPRRRP
jgi:hypothetical protein